LQWRTRQYCNCGDYIYPFNSISGFELLWLQVTDDFGPGLTTGRVPGLTWFENHRDFRTMKRRLLLKTIPQKQALTIFAGGAD
jgi:hypothetical protein